MLAIKTNTRYRFKTKRVKYTAIWKKSIKIVKESKLSFFTTFSSSIFLFPPPQFYYFRSSFLNSLLQNFNIFPPPPPPHFYCFPSKRQRGQNQAYKAKLKCDGLILAPWPFRRKTIEMRRRRRENNKNEEEVEEEEGKQKK